MKTYLAYGSNLNREWMEKLRGKAQEPLKYVLQGYRLLFRGKGYLTIEKVGNDKSDEYSIPVLLWKVDEKDELALDDYEAYPDLYCKRTLKLRVEGEDEEVFYYLMNPPYADKKACPTPEYLEMVRKGYREGGFSEGPLDLAIRELQD